MLSGILEGEMGKRKRRRRRKSAVHITPLGYAVLGVLIVITVIGIYFVAWSLGNERTAEAEATPPVTVSDATNTFAIANPNAPTPTLAPINRTPTPVFTQIPTQTPVPAATVTPGMANGVRLPTDEQIKNAVDGELLNSGVALRKGPDSGYEIVDKYASGTKLQIFEQVGDYYFCKVISADKYGYLAIKFVARFGLFPGEAPTPSPETKAGVINGVVSANKLSLRAVPTTEGNDPIGECNKDAKIWIYFQTNGFYYAEVVGSGEKGYLAVKYVAAEGAVPMGTPVPG